VLIILFIVKPSLSMAYDITHTANSTRIHNILEVDFPSRYGDRVMAWVSGCTTIDFDPTTRDYDFSPDQENLDPTGDIFDGIGCPWVPNRFGRFGISRARIISNTIKDLGVYTLRCTNSGITRADCYRTVDPDASWCGIIGYYCGPSYLPPGAIDVTVEIINHPPHITVSSTGTNLTPSGHARYNSRISLMASATDPDPGNIDLFWEIKYHPPAASSPSFSGSPTRSRSSPDLQFNDESDFGLWVLEAIADDAQGERVRREVEINVVNQVPRPVISGETRVPFGSDISLSVSADEDGGAYTSLVWEALEPGSTIWGVVSNDPELTMPAHVNDVGDWTFRVTVTDNESPPLTGTSADVYSVEVYNAPPELTISSVSTPFARVGETSNFVAEATDPDGGDVQIQVRVLQVPQLSESSEITVGSIIHTGNNRINFSRLNVAADAGTWIFEVIALDDEPEPWQEESDPKEVFIVVDADPEAHITQVGGSVPIGSLTGSLTLSSADSFDPDSPCEAEPLRCHLTHDGSGARRISRPITGRNWVVLEGALDDGTYHPAGPVQEVFGIRNGTEELSFPMAGLPPGLWTFELIVEDGEGNTDSITHMVEVVNENSRPLVFLSPPARYLISPFGISDTLIGFKGGLSFDPDNILTGNLPGIDKYSWDVLVNGIDCLNIPLSENSPSYEYELFKPGFVITSECQGVWKVELSIEDDDIPMQNNSASSVLTIGTCEGIVCIDFPTESLRKIVDFADNTDVLIFYHVDALALTDQRFNFGMYAKLDIYHQSDLSTPVFTSISPNVVTHRVSPLLVFHWDGYWGSERPQSGKYSIKLSLLGHSQVPVDALFEDFERDAIHIEVDELSITTDSDVYANVDQLNEGNDTLSIGYEIEGRVTPDRVEWRLLNEANDIVYRKDLTPDLRGHIDWDGQVRPETLIGTGNYSVEVEAFLHGASLTGVTSHEVILYQLRFETVAHSPDLAVMVNNDDDNLNGQADMGEGVALVSDENDLLEVNLVFEPAMEGRLEVLSNDTLQKIKLYANANRGGGSLAMPLTYNLPVDTVPPIFIEATQVGVADLRLLFTPTEHAVLEDSVQEVKNIGIEISNWERASTLSVDIAHLDHAYTETAAAIPRNSRMNNFIDDEIDRFHIGVDAPNLNADSARRETFTVNISTALDDGSEDDNPTPTAFISVWMHRI